MSFKKREKLTTRQQPDPLVDGILIVGFVMAVAVGIYSLVRLFKGGSR